jgi:probable HAF family extracellular repeat protein
MEERIIDLGTLELGTLSNAYNISANGNIVVGSSATNGGIGSRAFVWQNGVMTKLNGLNVNNLSVARGVSGDGSVIAGVTQISGVLKGWRFQNGTYQEIGNLGHTGGYSFPYDMSSNGQIIVGESRRANGTFGAFYWNSNVMTDIGVIPGVNTGSLAYGVDPTGTYVVGASYGGIGGLTQGFIWSVSGGIVGIGYPDLGVSRSSRAYAVTSNRIVVGSGTFSITEIEVAFVWQNGVFTKIGVLPGTTFSIATDISADGNVIVGYSYTTTNGVPNGPIDIGYAFRYTGGIMTNIGDLGTYSTPSDIVNAYSAGRNVGEDPTLDAFANTLSADGNNIAGASQVRMPNGSIEQHAFLYRLIRINNIIPYYDSNQKYVAQAKDNQKKFPDASGYTQFLKARASGRMYKYQ